MSLSNRLLHFWHVVSNIRPIVWLGLYLGLIPIFALIYYHLPVEQFRIPDNAGTDYGSWIYYSIVTITTLGFGDYTPAHGLAQAFTAIEVGCGITMLGFFLNAVGSMKSEIDVESELEKQRRVHFAMEQEKLSKYLPVILHRIKIYTDYCQKIESEKDLTKVTHDQIHHFITEALRLSRFLDAMENHVDLTLWPEIIQNCFSFVASVQMHETSDSPKILQQVAIKTSKIASDLQTAFTKAATQTN